MNQTPEILPNRLPVVPLVGAVPKDGPSAGVALTTALVSVLTGVPVRGDVAMTGEVTLRGRVLLVGGVREKVMAAHRVGMTTIILPRRNERDLAELPVSIRDEGGVRPRRRRGRGSDRQPSRRGIAAEGRLN